MKAWFRTRTFLAGLALASGFAVVSIGSSPSQAASLTGDTINGSLHFCTLGNGGNVFTPTTGSAPLTFGYEDGANTDFATFSATQLTIEDQVHDGACGWGMSFTDLTTPFPSLTLASSNFAPDLTFELTDDGTINVSWAGTETSTADFVAVFNIDGGDTAAPEPRSLALFAVGLIGVSVIRQRRRPAAQDASGLAA